MVPALGDSTGISIFIDSRIMISPSTSTLSPGLSWIFQTLPAISDFTLTTAMRGTSPEPLERFFRYPSRQSKRCLVHMRAQATGGAIDRRHRSVLQSWPQIGRAHV